ncbi:MAG: serine/threonine protein kinase [Anaerolineales bacterium]|nr:serine/threonine protein kinase [Anaerolineales bacterium]
MPLTTGQMLQSRYRIVSRLGHGGMGAVYRVWDTRLKISVALKEMVPQPGLDQQTLEELRQQFRREAQILARLSHPNLVRVGDFFEEDGNAYLAMDYIEGESLAARIGREGALPEDQVLAWAEQLLGALDYCHDHGVIHRDIKPQNIIIRSDGQAVLVDFGLVKLWDPNDPHTRTAMRGMGTPEYAPPEQYDAAAGHTDPRSDLYSLGATLYHALAGHAPPTATMRMANPEGFRPLRTLNPYVSPRLDAVVTRATELAVDRRFTTAQEMLAAMRGEIPVATTAPAGPPAATTQPKMAAAAPQAPPVSRGQHKRSSAWLWVLGAVAALALLFGIGAVALLLVRGGDGLLPAARPAETDASPQSGVVDETPTLTLTPTPDPTAPPTDTPVPSPIPTGATAAPTKAPTPQPSTTPIQAPTASVQPTVTAAPATTTPVEPTKPPASGALFTFEEWASWRRGDQPHGEFTQTSEQVHSGSYAAKLAYNFPASDQDFVVFARPASLAGQPDTLGAWVYGDGSGHYLNYWVQDAQDEIWSVHLGKVGGAGWKQMVGRLDPSLPWPSGHISGSDNGVVDYPVRFYALVLDRPGSGPQTGQIYVDDLSAWKGQAAQPATPVPGTPVPAATDTPAASPAPVSEGPLGFPAPTALDAWESAEGAIG